MKDLRKELQTTKAQIGALKSSQPTKEWVLEQITSVPSPSREPIRRKTELCRYWQSPEGCSYTKEECNFAHGDGDMSRGVKKGKAPTMVKVKDPTTGVWSLKESLENSPF